MHRLIYVSVCLIAAAVSAKADAALRPFVLYNAHTNMCLQPDGGNTALTTLIVQEPCDGSANQEWIYLSQGSAGFQFMNAKSAFCLETKGSPANGEPIQLWNCTKLTNDNWQITGVAKGLAATTLVSGVEGGNNSYCLDIPGGLATPGGAMQLYKCNGTVSQSWFLRPVSTVVAPYVFGLSVSVAQARAVLFDLTPQDPKLLPTACSDPGSLVVSQVPAPYMAVPPNTRLQIWVGCASTK